MKATTKYLIAICLASFLLRMAFVSQADGPAFGAYETIEQVDHISQTGAPLITQTPNGRYFPLPAFPYLLAFARLFLPDNIVFLAIPNLFAILAHAAVFLLVRELTGKERYALLAALASVFVPAYLSATLLTVSSLSLAIPLLLFCVTLYLKLRKTKEKRNLLLTLFILLSFTDPIVLICIPFLILSLILTTVREARGEAAQQEFAIFALFYLIWLYVLLYKRFIAAYGFRVFFANTPSVVHAATNQVVNAQLIASQIGVIIFGFALYATYKETAGEHIGIQGIIALALATALTLWLRVLPLTSGLSLFGTVAVVLAAVGVHHYSRFIRSLKPSPWHTVAGVLLAVLFVLTSVLPFATEGLRAPASAAPQSLHDAAAWIAENTPKDSLLLAPPEWGFLLETEANRPVYITENYLRYTNSDARLSAATAILDHSLTTLRSVPAIEYLVSPTASQIPCVNQVYAKEVFIAKVLCS